jgi:hypothetical protein
LTTCPVLWNLKICFKSYQELKNTQRSKTLLFKLSHGKFAIFSAQDSYENHQIHFGIVWF